MKPILLLALIIGMIFQIQVALAIDTASAIKGEVLYEKLRRDYPDSKASPEYDLPPRTVYISMIGTVGRQPVLDLSMPSEVWNKLGKSDREALIALLKSKIKDAREHPEAFAWTKPEAPVYPGEIANIRSVMDNAWEINVGRLDSDGYLVDNSIIVKGSDYGAIGTSDAAIVVYANRKDDPVYNSGLDGSVAQILVYHKKFINDLSGLQYSNWTEVIKTGTGYQASVTFRSKNEFGALVIHDQTFDFDKQGAVRKVTNNDQ